MKPSRATCVDVMNTRPLRTLSTIRRPSRIAKSSVANESSPRTRSEAPFATAVPLPIATPTSACSRAGAVVETVTGDGAGAVGPPRRVAEPQLQLGEGPRDRVERRQLRVETGVIPALELAAGHDVLRPQARLRGDRRGRRGVVAGHDD